MIPKPMGWLKALSGIIKGRAGSYLVHARLSVKYWYWACMQAAAVMRMKALDIKLAEGAPTFGDTVVIRRPEKVNFQEKGYLGTFMHWSPVVPMGAWVLTTREDGSEKMDLVSLPNNWKRVAERRWKLSRDPKTPTWQFGWIRMET